MNEYTLSFIYESLKFHTFAMEFELFFFQTEYNKTANSKSGLILFNNDILSFIYKREGVSSIFISNKYGIQKYFFFNLRMKTILFIEISYLGNFIILSSVENKYFRQTNCFPPKKHKYKREMPLFKFQYHFHTICYQCFFLLNVLL